MNLRNRWLGARVRYDDASWVVDDVDGNEAYLVGAKGCERVAHVEDLELEEESPWTAN